MKKRAMTYSHMVCEECGSVFVLPRKATKGRGDGHIKDIWCIKCKKVTKHIEYTNDTKMYTERFKAANLGRLAMSS
jgi:hypothetical protein